jgi:ribosome-associated protein
MDASPDATVRAECCKATVLAAIDDRKGIDAVALDVAAVTDVTDYMVIVTGSSNRHVRAIVASVLEAAKEADLEVLGTEGREGADWVLIDLADVVVHVMRPQTREFYDLERFWESLDEPDARQGP